jgi:O-antigen/teichoic acid export membrane protein
VRSLLGTGVFQLCIQAIAQLAGIAAVWLLPKSEFAYYTVATAMLGTLTVLADCGVTQGVIARGGRLWQDRAALSGAFASGNRLRGWLAIASMLGSLPVLYVLLRQNGADTSTATLTSLSIVPLFLGVLNAQLLEVILKLDQRLQPLQWVQLRGTTLRVLLVAGVLSIFPVAWLACAGAGVAQLWTASRTRRLVGPIIDLEARPDAAATREIVRQMGRIAPSAVYYAFAGQLNVWLISLFGHAESVAEVGALARLAMVFTVASSIIALRYVPRFARLQANNRDLLKIFWAAQGALLAAAAAVIGLVALFPTPALALLGPNYASLTFEVTLAVAGSAAAIIAGASYSLAAARSVILTPMIVVPFAVGVQAVLVAVLPISTVSGVLWLGVISNLAFWLMSVTYFSYAVAKHAR